MARGDECPTCDAQGGDFRPPLALRITRGSIVPRAPQKANASEDKTAFKDEKGHAE